MGHSPWSGGAAYEDYIGRWSRPIAEAFLRWLAHPPGHAWLDFGCGTGALAQAIVAQTRPRLVVGCDRSPDYVAHATATTAEPRCRFQVADLPELPHLQPGFDAVVSGLVLNFLPDPSAALQAFKTILKPRGTIAAYVWDYAEGMQLLRTFWNAVVTLDPASARFDEGRLFPLCAPADLAELFSGAGLREVEVTDLTVPTRLRSFDDYWTPFLGGQGPGGQYIAQLDPVHRERLAAHLRTTLPIQADGSLHLTARAWAVRGVAT